MMWLSCSFTVLLAASFNAGVHGLSECLSAKCMAGENNLVIDSCELTDADIDDIATCFDTVGRRGITSLYLENNEFSSLPFDLFEDMSNVEYLSLERNKLDSIDESTFVWFPSSLVDLSIASNELTTLPPVLFAYLESLLELNFGDNQLVTLPDRIFDDLASLKTLNMRSNQLASLDVDIFETLSSAEFVDIRDNALTTLPEGVFENLGSGTSLQFLLLFGNSDLQCIPTSYTTGYRTSSSYRSTHTYYDEVVNDGLCVCTDVSWCGDGLTCTAGTEGYTCEGLDDCLYAICLAGETKLVINSCELTDTDLDNVAMCFDRVGRDGITSLTLINNDFTSLPSDLFEDMSNVEYLSLGWNQLDSIDAATFQPMASSLGDLYIHYNELTTIPPGLFAGMGSLLDLRMRDNQLVTLPEGIFDDLVSVKTLDIGVNQLASLDVDIFDNLSSAEFVDIGFNALTTLPEGVFENLGSGTSLRFLLLRGNSDLQCLPTSYATGDRTSNSYSSSNTYTNEVENDGLCECTDVATCDDGLTCTAGTEGYTCEDERVIVEAGEVTTVTVDATWFYARKWGTGCWPSGCIPENTRDGKKKASSRWSCEGTGCCITYHFNEPQDIVKVRIAFHNGNKGGILGLGVYENGDYHSQFMSSGATLGYQRHPLNTVQTQEIKLCLEDYSANTSGWLDITEVKFMVKD